MLKKVYFLILIGIEKLFVSTLVHSTCLVPKMFMIYKSGRTGNVSSVDASIFLRRIKSVEKFRIIHQTKRWFMKCGAFVWMMGSVLCKFGKLAELTILHLNGGFPRDHSDNDRCTMACYYIFKTYNIIFFRLFLLRDMINVHIEFATNYLAYVLAIKIFYICLFAFFFWDVIIFCVKSNRCLLLFHDSNIQF